MSLVKRSLFTALALVLVVGAVSAQEPPKRGDDAPNDGPGLPNAVGGPDTFGYTYEDSAEPGCSYDFIDISGTGTLVVSGDDVSSGPLATSAPFDFYGTTYTSLVMTSNGYVGTDATDTGGDLSNDCPLPAAPSTSAGARMYAVHDDLVSNTGYSEYFPVCPRTNSRCDLGEDCTIFQWEDSNHFGGTELFDVQAILYHQTGDIVYQMGPGNPETGSGSTTGIQNEAADDGLTYACDTAGSIPDNTAVCFRSPTSPPLGICQALIPTEIPTLSKTGILALFLALAGAGLFLMRRFV